MCAAAETQNAAGGPQSTLQREEEKKMVRLLGAVVAAGVLLCGCVSAPSAGSSGAAPPNAPAPASESPAGPTTATPGPSGGSAPLYRCDDGTQFNVRFAEDTAVVERTGRGNEELLRDAGGVTPQQTVYSNTRMRAEFGLGSDGREAKLRLLQDQKVLSCTRG
jgi:hypothetical protein